MDLPLLRYATCHAPVDGLLISALDRLPSEPLVARHYTLDGKVIPFGRGRRDLNHQAKLGARLAAVNPVYTTAPSNPDEYAEWVANELCIPLVGTSFGAAHCNKMLCARRSSEEVGEQR